jgi:hypothetical protein
MILSFVPCSECLEKYRSLAHDPACEYTLNVMPFCALQWPDEHPKDLDDIIFDRERHGECLASIIRLVGVRTHLWRAGAIPEDCGQLWAEAQRLIPEWPGFKRLALEEQERESLDGCAKELDDFIGAVVQDFPHVISKDEGGGLTTFTARREGQ